MNARRQVLSKAEYARLKKVSAPRVSQWISSGKIGTDALVGKGRQARIDVAIADQQLLERLDLSQRAGNGISTRLEAPPAEAESPAPDSLEQQFKRERLEGLQRENRKRAEEEAARAGRYVDAHAATAQMAKIAAKTMTIIDGSLPEIASAIAAQFALSQRDVLHLLRAEFRNVRARAAGGLRDAAAALPVLVEAELELVGADEETVDA